MASGLSGALTLGGAPPTNRNKKSAIASIYTAQLEVKRDGLPHLTIDTPLPENFTLSLSSQYDRPFAKPLSELAGEAMGKQAGSSLTENIARASTGMTSIAKYLSAAVWSGGSTLTIDIPFVIHAYENAQLEVSDKMKNLLQLVAPGEVLGMLRAPGPYQANVSALTSGDPVAGNLVNSFTLGGDDITLSIGRFFVFNPCIITNVVCTFDTQFESTGQPLAATINVTFEAYYTTTKEDLDKFFVGSL